MVRETRGHPLKRGSALGRNRQKIMIAHSIIWRRGRRLLQHDVGVSAANSERTHPGPPWDQSLDQGLPMRSWPRTGCVEIKLRIRRAEVHERRNLRDARASNTALNQDLQRRPRRRDGQYLPSAEPIRQKPISGSGAKNFSQGGNFDRIAELRSGTVGFDIGNRPRINSCQRLGGGNDFHLAVDARRRIAGFAGAVVIDCGSADDGMDRVSVGERVARRLRTTIPAPAPPRVPRASNRRAGNGRQEKGSCPPHTDSRRVAET